MMIKRGEGVGISTSTAFKKDVEVCRARGYDLSKLNSVLRKIASGVKLDPKNRDHKIVGKFKGFRECHIEPDWLLIYKIDSDTLYLVRTGTHTDLFD